MLLLLLMSRMIGQPCFTHTLRECMAVLLAGSVLAQQLLGWPAHHSGVGWPVLF